MRLSDIGSKLSEGYRVVPGFDRERYQERPGLEGPFHTKSGKVVYYDKAEGKYYDPDTDMYIEYDDWRAMNEQGVTGPKNCWPGHRKVGTKPGTGKNAGKRVNDCEKIGEEVDPADVGEYDREGDMAHSQLKTAKDAAAELQSILDADENLPEWVQSKITKAVDYLDTARDYMKSEKQGVGEGMLDNPGEQDSPVASAITRRILLQRTDLLAKYGPEKVGAAVDEVADFVGDVDEIGSSDVSGWIRHVEQMLGNMTEGVAEGFNELDDATNVVAIQKLSDSELMRYYQDFKKAASMTDDNQHHYALQHLAKEIKRRKQGVAEDSENKSCPLPTQDLELNTKNRNEAIQAKHIQYGPLNADEPGNYWKRIAVFWNTTEKAAQESNCGNCSAFDVSPRMLDCMPGKLEDEDGTFGYCWMHKFKCHSARSCRTWAKGGPITTDKTSLTWDKDNQDVSEVSRATIDRYVAKASDAHGDADFKARMSKNDPNKRSYHIDQKRTAEKRRQGISRALDRMSREGVAEGTDPNTQSHADAFKSETDTMKPGTTKYVGRKGGKEVTARKDEQGNVKFYHRDGIKGPLKRVNEMDSQGYKGSRDDYELGKGKEHTGRPVTAKKATTDAERIMNRAHNKMMNSMSSADKVSKGWRNPDVKEGVSQGNYNVGLEDIGKPVLVGGEQGYVLLHIGYDNGSGKLVAKVLQPDTGANGYYDLKNISRVQQGVAEGVMSTIANKVMGAAPEQPKYKVGQRVKYETSPHQPDWKDGGRGVGVITAYKNGHYMINGNPVNHFEIKGVVDQGVAEVSKATLNQYVPKAVDAHGHADFSARMSKDDPTKRSYHVDQKHTAEKRRQGISRALDRMSKMEGVSEAAVDISVGDDVIITGAVKYKGATGVVDSVGRDGNFIVVNLYNHGKQSFQSTDVSPNDYAGSEAEESEMQRREMGESAPRSALGKAIKEVSKFKR